MLCLGFLFTTACEKDATVEKQKEQIIGTWKLTSALRNGNPTETLDNFKLEFENDTLLYSNLSGTREEQTYLIKDSYIETKGARINPAYEIIQISDSTLTLKMSLNEVSFDFEFIR